MTDQLAVEIVEHFLRLIGLGTRMAEGRVRVAGESADAQAVLDAAFSGSAVIALRPQAALLDRLGVTSHPADAVHWRGAYLPEPRACFALLRGFDGARRFSEDGAEVIVSSDDVGAVWGWRRWGAGGILLIGTDLANDLVRFRQGDPGQTPPGNDREVWGYSGERPDYLFEKQLNPQNPLDRPADWPLLAIADLLSRKLKIEADPILPSGARCALVITGDTDVATSHHYRAQRDLLGDLPITYFLRTACAPSEGDLRALDADPHVDLQIHPDALEAPDRYGALLQEQCDWFERNVGRRPTSLRNHGYLNDGYWRHASPWIAQKLSWSSNLPGVDGRVLNGSLLPGRLALGETLTPHWSVVTCYGDGLIFALKFTDQQAAAHIEQHVDALLANNVAPALVTLNLHPVNVEHTRHMHDVLHRLVRKGALPWSLAQCAQWFEQRDRRAM